MKIGLLFGSFNPVHIGHLAIANYMAEFTDLQQVWLVVSPHNPLKNKKDLADGKKRLAQVKKAVGKNPKIKVSDIEFALPQPNYTIHTLEVFKKKFPKYNFVLLMGSDNLNLFHKWKDYKRILNSYKIYVYPRFSPLKGLPAGKAGGLRGIFKNHSHIKTVNAPRIDISSTFIREAMKKGKDVRYFLA